MATPGDRQNVTSLQGQGGGQGTFWLPADAFMPSRKLISVNPIPAAQMLISLCFLALIVSSPFEYEKQTRRARQISIHCLYRTLEESRLSGLTRKRRHTKYPSAIKAMNSAKASQRRQDGWRSKPVC